MSNASIEGGLKPRPSFFSEFILAFLSSRLLPVLFVAVLVASYLFRDSLGIFFDSLSESFSFYCPFIPAVVFGLIFGRFLFLWYILRGVIVVVEPIEGNASCLRMTQEAFSKLIPPDVPFTPFSTSTGEPYYIAKGFDGEGMLIPGDVHSKDEDFIRLMAYRDRFSVWLSDYHRSVDRSVELELVPFMEGQDFARVVVRRAIELEGLRRGVIVSEKEEDDGGD